jgi:hypothetical protein
MWKEVRRTSRKMINVSSEFTWNVSALPNPSSHTMALGSTQPLTEMSTSNLPLSKGQPACNNDKLTTIYWLIV